MPPLTAPVDSISTLGGVDLGLVHAVFEPVMRTPIPLVDLDLRCTLVEDVDLEIPFFWICSSFRSSGGTGPGNAPASPLSQ